MTTRPPGSRTCCDVHWNPPRRPPISLQATSTCPGSGHRGSFSRVDLVGLSKSHAGGRHFASTTTPPRRAGRTPLCGTPLPAAAPRHEHACVSCRAGPGLPLIESGSRIEHDRGPETDPRSRPQHGVRSPKKAPDLHKRPVRLGRFERATPALGEWRTPARRVRGLRKRSPTVPWMRGFRALRGPDTDPAGARDFGHVS